MPHLTLNWDLSIVVFFAVAMSYGFLIGRDRSMTMLVAMYIAIFATEGIGKIWLRLVGSNRAILHSIGIPVDLRVLSLAKIFVFAICLLIFLTRSGIELTHGKETRKIISIIHAALLGFSSAGLAMVTVLAYGAGGSIANSSVVSSPFLSPIVGSSILLQLLTQNPDLWFTLPALLIITLGLIRTE